MKKIITAFSLLLMVIVLLTGCASQPEDNSQISNEAQTSNSEIKKIVKLCYMSCDAYSGENEEEIIANCKDDCDFLEEMAKQGCDKFCSKKENWKEHWNSLETCMANCKADVNAYK